MRRLWVAVAFFVLLALTVPWWWIGTDASKEEGSPWWVYYALIMNVVLAVSIAWMLGRFWAAFEKVSHDPPDEE